MSKTKSYTFNGFVDNNLDSWILWVEIAEKIFSYLGVCITECGVLSKNGNRIKSVKNIKEKLIKLYEKGDVIKSISFYSLKENYNSYIFDFTVSLTRNSCFDSYVTLILNYKYYFNFEIADEKIVELLRNSIIAEEGEIYEMDIDECPEFYAGKANPKTFYKTLKVLKKI